MRNKIGSRRAHLRDKTEDVAIDLFDLLERLDINIDAVKFAGIISWAYRMVDGGVVG